MSQAAGVERAPPSDDGHERTSTRRTDGEGDSPHAQQGLVLLTSVVVVCRAHPRVSAISEITNRIDSFVGANAKWTVPTACAAGLLGLEWLLRRIVVYEDPGMDRFLKRKHFSNALTSAIHHDKFEAVKWLMEEYLPRGRVRGELEEAASSGQLRTIRWLWEHHRERVVWTAVLLFYACKGGHVELAKWLYTEVGLGTLAANDKIKAQAIQIGNVELLEWAVELGASVRLIDTQEAAKLGHVPILEWVARRTNVRVKPSLVSSVVRAGHLEVVKWLASRPGPSFTVIGSDLQYGSAPMIYWILENLEVEDKKSLARGISAAAGRNDFELVKLLHEHSSGGSCSMAAMDNAARVGNLEMLQWLHENRSERCTTNAMDDAALFGHLDVVKWLHENRSEGCTTQAMESAAVEGHFEVIKWLHAHRTEGCTSFAMNLAAYGGHLDVVKWLQANCTEGCTEHAMDGAAMNGHLDVVKWLDANRAERCTTDAMDRAASNGDLEMLRWLHEHRTEGCTEAATLHATSSGHVHVVDWMLESGLASVNWDTLRLLVEYDVLGAVKWMLPRLPTEVDTGFHARLRSVEMAQRIHADGRLPLGSDHFHDAVAFGNWPLLQWLMHECPDAAPTRRELERAEEAVEECDEIKRNVRPRRAYMEDAILEFDQLQAE